MYMKIGLFSPAHNRQTMQLQQQLEVLAPGASQHFHFPLQNDGLPKVALDENGVYWDGINVAELDCAYVHGFNYDYPVKPVAELDIDWTAWQVDHLAEQQRYSFLLSAFTELDRYGIKLFNSPSVLVQNYMKLDMFEDLRQAGFRVPKMICTNDGESAARFMQSMKTVMCRPATGRASWQLFTDKVRQRVILPKKSPLLLAELKEGALIRVYLFNGKPLLILKYGAPDCTGTERVEHLEVFQAVHYPELNEELNRLATFLSLGWGQILLVPGGNSFWIYDIDADPIIDWLPEPYRQGLTQAIAQGLLQQDIDITFSEAPQPRSTIFLRSMLWLLLDIERQKYR